MSHFLGDDDDDFVLAGVEAYNNFLFEEFCAPDPTRLIGLAQIPSLGIDTAVDALRKAKARGAKGVHHLELAVGRRRACRPTTTRSGPRPCDEGLPVVDPHQHHQPRAARGRRARPSAASGQPALRHEQRGHARQGDRRHEPRVLDGRRQHHRRCCSPACSSGSPSCRSAGSRPVSAGSRTSSSRLDDRYWRNRVVGRPADHSSRRRSTGTATTRRSFITDRSGIALRHQVGVDNIMWSSDYPHHGNDWPYSRKVIEETMGAHPGRREGEDHRRQRGADLEPRRLGACPPEAWRIAPRSIAFRGQPLQRAVVRVVDDPARAGKDVLAASPAAWLELLELVIIGPGELATAVKSSMTSAWVASIPAA